MSKREYTKGDLTVLWDSDLCTHCENCFKGLPQVFNPAKRPWVDLSAAPLPEIINQVLECPSGALRIKE